MSDLVDEHLDGPLLAGDAPRLAAPGPSGPAADLPAPAGLEAPTLPSLPANPAPVLNAPGAAPVLHAPPASAVATPINEVLPDLPKLPTLPTAGSAPTPAPVPAAEPASIFEPLIDAADLPSLPTLPTPAPKAVVDETVDAPVTSASDTSESTPPDADAHPMAHLMQRQAGPSEASKRAAEIRAAKKAKAKKVKIGVAIGAIVFAAVVGPPLGKWFVNAINEAGDTTTEETG